MLLLQTRRVVINLQHNIKPACHGKQCLVSNLHFWLCRLTEIEIVMRTPVSNVLLSSRHVQCHPYPRVRKSWRGCDEKWGLQQTCSYVTWIGQETAANEGLCAREMTMAVEPVDEF